MIIAVFVLLIEKRPIKKMWKGILMYPIFMGSWLLINFKCLFKQDTTWEKIDHTRDVKIDDVKESS